MPSVFPDQMSFFSASAGMEIAKSDHQAGITILNTRQECHRILEAAPAADQGHDCDWAAFLRAHGRVPRLGDEKPPWDYPGWLLYYCLLLEDHIGVVAKRWDYWRRTMVAGKLLDEPIPRIDFRCDGQQLEGMKRLDEWVRMVERYDGGWSGLTALLDWFLWGFGLAKEQPKIPAELNERLYREVNLGPWLLEPFDYLGAWIAAQKGKWNPFAFFPTPFSVVQLMVRMSMADGEDARAKTTSDPAMGSARLLMCASNYSVRLSGSDIDVTMVKVAKINGALYVPWLIRPFPESFFIFHTHEKRVRPDRDNSY